jgi:hypothetical protein
MNTEVGRPNADGSAVQRTTELRDVRPLMRADLLRPLNALMTMEENHARHHDT